MSLVIRVNAQGRPQIIVNVYQSGFVWLAFEMTASIKPYFILPWCYIQNDNDKKVSIQLTAYQGYADRVCNYVLRALTYMFEEKIIVADFFGVWVDNHRKSSVLLRSR